MKKVILTLGIVFACYQAESQIVIKESINDSIVWHSKMLGIPKLVHFYATDLSEYVLYYQNANYTHIKDIQYITIGDIETTREFFNILLNVANGTTEDITIGLDGKTWIISKSMGSIMIWSSDSSFYLMRNNVESILKLLK